MNAEELLGSFGLAYLPFLYQCLPSRHPKSIKMSLQGPNLLNCAQLINGLTLTFMVDDTGPIDV